jgi:hypothetical protein
MAPLQFIQPLSGGTTKEGGDTVKVTLHLDGRAAAGGSALIMHNERLADPLDPFTRAIAAISKKRGKTEADHQEIGRLEFFGGLYADPMITPDNLIGTPCLPAWNVLRCLQDGARRHKRGADVLRGIYPIGDTATLIYDGPPNPEGLWVSGEFSLRKTVGVQRARTVRTRPVFTDWQARLDVEVDATVWDLHTLRVCWRDAGTYSGIGDMRPVYGRFVATVVGDGEQPADVPPTAKAAMAR